MSAHELAMDIKERSRLTKDEWREYTKTVWQIPNIVHPDHPAVFPEEIPRRLIKLFTFVGESVLDPFAGTGMTALAALNLGRHAICVDCNPTYTDIARRAAEPLQTDEARLTVNVHVIPQGVTTRFPTLGSASRVILHRFHLPINELGLSRPQLGAVAPPCEDHMV